MTRCNTGTGLKVNCNLVFRHVPPAEFPEIIMHVLCWHMILMLISKHCLGSNCSGRYLHA